VHHIYKAHVIVHIHEEQFDYQEVVLRKVFLTISALCMISLYILILHFS